MPSFFEHEGQPARLHRLRRGPAHDRPAPRPAALPEDAPPAGPGARRARATAWSRWTCSATAARTARATWRAYSMPFFGEQVIGLLDHLEVDEAVAGRHVAGRQHDAGGRRRAPRARARDGRGDAGARQRAAGLRDRLHAADVRADLRRAGDEGASRGRRAGSRPGAIWGADVLLDTVRQQPGPERRGAAGPVLRARRAAPRRPAHDRRRPRWSSATTAIRSTRSATPTRSSHELPDARLLRADSLLELRLTPERLTGEIAEFVDECWKPRRKAARAA